MGVVKRQGIKQSIVTYAAVVVGALNMVFLSPAAFTAEELGIFKFVQDSAVLVAPFLFWGGAELIVRFFPRFRQDGRGHHGYLFFLHLIFLLGILTLSLAAFFFQEKILAYYDGKSPLFRAYLPFVLPLAMLYTSTAIFSSYASCFQRTVVPAMFNELFSKIGLALLVLCYWMQAVDFPFLFWGQLLMWAFIISAQCWYLWRLGEWHLRPDLRFLRKPLLREIGSFGLYGLVGSLGSRLALQINLLMVGSLSGLKAAGVFAVAFFISDSIDIPRKAISRISSPLLADKWAKGKLGEIEEIYQKSALNQFIVGLGLLLAVWVSVDELFRLMPNGEAYAAGKYVILLIGLSRVVDMATGVNSEILSYSPHFRLNFYLILLLAILNVAGNFYLIPRHGLLGAALATLLSLCLYNLLKCWLIRWKLGIQPFSWAMLGVLLSALVAWGLVWLLPGFGSPLLGILVQSTLALAVFGGSILAFELSADVSQLVGQAWKRVRK